MDASDWIWFDIYLIRRFRFSAWRLAFLHNTHFDTAHHTTYRIYTFIYIQLKGKMKTRPSILEEERKGVGAAIQEQAEEGDKKFSSWSKMTPI
jgi:hypothetical protein